MSHTMMILELMADGKLYTARQISAKLGLNMDQTYLAMSCLRKHKATRAVDQPYSITDAGREWMAARKKRETSPKQPKQKKVDDSLPILHDDTPEPPFEHRLVAAPAVPDAIVSTAIQSRPALQAVWGAQ